MTRFRMRRKGKKKTRKSLWITLLIMMIFIGGGWGGYHLFTHKDVQAEDIGVEVDFFDFPEFDIQSEELPVSSDGIEGLSSPKDDFKAIYGDTNGETATTNSSNAKDIGEINSSNSVSSSKRDHNLESKDIEKEIERKYTATFNILESKAISKIDKLAENALNDYKSGRSLSDISSTYMSAANKLQKKLDEVFNDQLERMKAELKKNGLSNDLALQVKAEYKKAIATKKSEMLNKVSQVK
ncbi:hypothetical protein QPK24_04655 [Paenibacillus polygoni]|uniref:Uncharacterized protein n=1 Tax=Paenibacillus polygoni TaxID=3050112 RepID=A0ABY8X3B9_9BACL|nr:hypothetical protein [Paenibacillus polygoni]WIV20012.1 hypothetical protein QPK24_04655 [Paenibacillus polygoni]